MAAICFNCGKGIMYGQSHKHHKGVAGGQWVRRAPRTRKIFKPNLHSAKVLINGAYKRVKLCTKCQRLLVKSHKAKIEETKVPQEQPQVVVAA